MLVVACGDGAEPEVPIPVVVPDIPTLSHDAGHLEVAQRGLPLDRFDLQVLPGIRDYTVQDISNLFGVVVINVPFIDRNDVCVRSADAAPLLPAQAVAARLADIRDAGVTTPSVAVNVDLLTPERTELYHVCLAEGAPAARFDVPEYRRQVVQAFKELAAIEGVDYVTVGMEMNAYYHNLFQGELRDDDYSNFVLVYREIYAEMKAVNPDLKVGPGMSYTEFRTRSMDAAADELQIPTPSFGEDGYDGYVRLASALAFERTIQPFLQNGVGNNAQRTADYLGLTFLPFPESQPYFGDPQGSGGDELQAQLAWHDPIAVLTGFGGENALPIAVVQADWPEGLLKRPKKAEYLKVLKQALSPHTLEWLSWRRFSDLPREPAESSACARFTQGGGESTTLRYSSDYCGSGVVDQYGSIEDSNSVFRTLTDAEGV